MSARIITYSNDPNNKDMSIEDWICYCARVSNPSNQHNNLNNDRLINYLISNHHWSPFEMISICLEIETTRDIARQILRHRSFSFQEFSQRYAVQEESFQIRETRLQDYKNRQNSLECNNDKLISEWIERQEKIQLLIQDNYKWAIENGIAKEQARIILPEGMTPSKLYMNGTLRSWIHYIQLRTHISTQKEHREIALLCAKEIEKIFPLIKNFISN